MGISLPENEIAKDKPECVLQLWVSEKESELCFQWMIELSS